VRAYVATTGVIFALLTLAHLWRVVAEGRQVADAFFILVTAAAAAMSVWAWRVLRRRRPAAFHSLGSDDR
jgi:hypothetical protein